MLINNYKHKENKRELRHYEEKLRKHK